jgi:sugar phosphate isomerase/epimerase
MAGNKHDRIRLAVSHLIWGFDLSRPDLLLRFLDDASAIGYEGVLAFDTTTGFWLNRPREFKSLLDARKLELAGVILRPGLDFIATRRLVEWMAEVGADVMVISGRDGRQEDWDISLPILQRHGEIAAEHGLRAVYHHHTDWIAETMEQYERLLAETDRRYLGAMLDCGHATKYFVGHSALEFFERNHSTIEYVEFKDFSPQTDLGTEVGRGSCDFKGIAGAIKQHGYKGWVVVEQNPAGAMGGGKAHDPKVASQTSYRYIRETLGLGGR